VEAVREQEGTVFGRSGTLTEAYANSLFKLMAYKDEYEVARLYLDLTFERRLRAQFGEDARLSYNLHPPVLRALGMNKKLKLGPWFKQVFKVLHALRRVRGTRWDPFGYAKVRRAERQLVRTFLERVPVVLAKSTVANRHLVEQLISLPEQVRGYENIKLESVALYQDRFDQLCAEISSGSA
jgi:indolepyruvate ferredoxin oxidoreductase